MFYTEDNYRVFIPPNLKICTKLKLANFGKTCQTKEHFLMKTLATINRVAERRYRISTKNVEKSWKV